MGIIQADVKVINCKELQGFSMNYSFFYEKLKLTFNDTSYYIIKKTKT